MHVSVAQLKLHVTKNPLTPFYIYNCTEDTLQTDWNSGKCLQNPSELQQGTTPSATVGDYGKNAVVVHVVGCNHNKQNVGYIFYVQLCV